MSKISEDEILQRCFPKPRFYEWSGRDSTHNFVFKKIIKTWNINFFLFYYFFLFFHIFIHCHSYLNYGLNFKSLALSTSANSTKKTTHCAKKYITCQISLTSGPWIFDNDKDFGKYSMFSSNTMKYMITYRRWNDTY